MYFFALVAGVLQASAKVSLFDQAYKLASLSLTYGFVGYAGYFIGGCLWGFLFQ